MIIAIEGIIALNVTHPFLLPINVLSSRWQLELELNVGSYLHFIYVHPILAPLRPMQVRLHAADVSNCIEYVSWCETSY